jgi:hypothetical protein
VSRSDAYHEMSPAHNLGLVSRSDAYHEMSPAHNLGLVSRSDAYHEMGLAGIEKQRELRGLDR